ncbi:hypothetical protein KFU94_62695 [Chloroflexi bacterium TSY]|nr:hypothetical protein [Chloroflexi bacterium TSY]
MPLLKLAEHYFYILSRFFRVDSFFRPFRFALCHSSLYQKVKYYDFYFCADQWHGMICNLEPEKCDDLRWFPLTQLPDNTIPYIKTVTEKIFFQKEPFSVYGWAER